MKISEEIKDAALADILDEFLSFNEYGAFIAKVRGNKELLTLYNKRCQELITRYPRHHFPEMDLFCTLKRRAQNMCQVRLEERTCYDATRVTPRMAVLDTQG
jgi:hypothetical protein